MISFPFDNKSAEIQDRVIDSDTFSEYLKKLTGNKNGVFAEISTKMQVIAGDEMTVKVKPGDGIVEGKMFIEPEERTLSVQASESADRIDTVVIRLNKAERLTDLYVVKGTAGTSPKQPELTREGDIYELGIANIYVPKLTTTISQDRITDTRLNSERCGVAPVLGDIDTTELYIQYQTSLDKFLETVEQAIDGTLAGNLQNQITENKKNIETNTNSIDELNTDVSYLKEIKRVKLFDGASQEGQIQLSDSIKNYSYLVFNINSSSSGNPFGHAMLSTIFAENIGGTVELLFSDPAPNDTTNNRHSTYIGRGVFDDEYTLNLQYPIYNVIHTSGANHGGVTKYFIREIWGVR